jgi:hypothetical protein
VFYTVWNGTSWSALNDIVPPSGDIIRNAIAVDRRDILHMVFGGTVYGRNNSLYYRRAYAGESWSAATWSTPHLINQGSSYMADVAVDSQGTIHVVYDDTVGRTSDSRYDENAETVASDIYYRNSANDGQTWSPVLPLFPSELTGSSRSRIEIDSSDTIHVTWDEGWDRLTGWGDPVYGAYTSSSDRGKTWSPVITVTYPVTGVAQMTAGSNGAGGVMLVWRLTSLDTIYYQWSADGGLSWGNPAAIPDLYARPWVNPFDMYATATDSAGRIHLVVVGRRVLERTAPLGVYHLEWNGQFWSGGERIYGGPGFPEYPRIVVSQGNQLHAAWFVREDQWSDKDTGPHQVWYSHSQSAAPQQVVTPVPTSTPVPPSPTPRPAPTITPYPTLSLADEGLPDGLYTDNDDVLRLAIALSPVALLAFVLVVVRMRWIGKSRR